MRGSSVDWGPWAQIAGAGFFIYGYTWEIPNFLVKAGKGIKKRAFPTVRIANETNMYLTFYQYVYEEANLEFHGWIHLRFAEGDL